MKSLFKKVLFILCSFFICGIVKAEKFSIGDYISGEYVKMVGKDTTKYLTIQFIMDSRNNFVYCIEPFTLVDEDTENYNVYESNLDGYSRLSEEQKRKISLIAFYGYGYSNRMTSKWYAITQLLIWKTVDPDSEFYFTDTLNGQKIDKYTGSINEILADLKNHDNTPNFIKDYSVNYKDNLVITNYDYSYDIESNYNYVDNPSNRTLTVKEVTTDGYFTFTKSNAKYLKNVVIYDSPNSQDLIRPGKVINKKHTINVNMNIGSIVLDIRKENSNIYSIESDFTNTCYEISKSSFIDKICTTNDNLVYKFDMLPYGEYEIKQISVGKGYEVDTNIYKVNLDTKEKTIILENNLIKNKIELVKYYCINDNCLYEENAIFNIYDSNDALVGSITTDSNGYGYLDVGYGKYIVKQNYGIDNYTFVNDYDVEVLNSNDVYITELYNYFIEDNGNSYDSLIPEDISNNVNNEDVLPPKTGTKLANLVKMLYNMIIVVICCSIKNYKYNN